MKAVLLVSHGSRSSKTKEEVGALVEVLKKCGKADIFELAFLELELPSMPEGIDICAARGAVRIVVLLTFLNSGRHVNTDIPQIVREAQVKYPQISFSITTPVGQHPGIADLFTDLIDHIPPSLTLPTRGREVP